VRGDYVFCQPHIVTEVFIDTGYEHNITTGCTGKALLGETRSGQAGAYGLLLVAAQKKQASTLACESTQYMSDSSNPG
jgi:hypothetical protein